MVILEGSFEICYHLFICSFGAFLFGGGGMIGAGIHRLGLGSDGRKIAVILSSEAKAHIDKTSVSHAVGVIISVLRTVGLYGGHAVGRKDIFACVIFLVKLENIFAVGTLCCGDRGRASPWRERL